MDTHTEASWAIGNDPPLYAHIPARSSKPQPRAPPPDPRLKPGFVFVASVGVKTEQLGCHDHKQQRAGLWIVMGSLRQQERGHHLGQPRTVQRRRHF